VRHPQLTEPAFRRLLAWLDGGVDSSGETYLEMRRRLIAYFDRRNCPSPADLADDTLRRVASTLEQPGPAAFTPPARYCYTVARFVFLEERRRRESASVDPSTTGERFSSASHDRARSALAVTTDRLDCLDQCLRALDKAKRDLIVEYYGCAGRGAIDTRRQLAARLGITMNTLRCRASHIREAIERCMAQCDPHDRDERD
jgi:DNA-directed RNA polymerase specialized sigma24 family protein